MKDQSTAIRAPSLLDALMPLGFMIVMLTWSIVLFGVDAASGPLQVALILSAVVAAVVAHKNGHTWERLGEEIVKGISLAMAAIMILLMVGALIGVWNLSGTIATVVYLGINYINPSWFYFAVALLAGAAVAVVMQQELLIAFADDLSLSTPFAAAKSIWVTMANGFVLESPYPQINELFSGGGMSSMLSTVWLILGAMSFGAMMDYGGFNSRLITPVIQRVRSDGGAIATVMLTAIGFNIVGGDQYIAIVLPARMFMVTFRQRGLHPETLATAVENSGTVTSPLIPWNSCGAYMSAALGVSTFAYFPYCFFNFLNPILGLTYGFVGINVQRLAPESQPAVASLPSAPMVDQQK